MSTFNSAPVDRTDDKRINMYITLSYMKNYQKLYKELLFL